MRARYEPGDRLRSPATGIVWEVIKWTHSVIMRNTETGTTTAIPAIWADDYERLET